MIKKIILLTFIFISSLVADVMNEPLYIVERRGKPNIQMQLEIVALAKKANINLEYNNVGCKNEVDLNKNIEAEKYYAEIYGEGWFKKLEEAVIEHRKQNKK